VPWWGAVVIAVSATLAGLAIEAPPVTEESTSTCCNSNLNSPFFSPVVDSRQVSSVEDEVDSGAVLQLMDACRQGDVHVSV
jgi:hypothetical protein